MLFGSVECVVFFGFVECYHCYLVVLNVLLFDFIECYYFYLVL